MEQGTALWENLMLWLRGNMTLSSYDTWVRQLKFKGIYGDEFVLIAPNPSSQDFLQSHYTKLFASGLAEITSKETYKGERIAYKPVFVFGAENEIDVPNLNPRYTFENFVVGSNNNLAHAAALAIAQGQKNFNPFLIYGGPGLGKTHLMQAIGHRIKELNPSARILYVTCEEFTNDLIRAIQNNQNESFRNRYRHVDVLLVDDIQFIAGKTSSQEEFFHTFNALYAAEKQIVMTSDLHPQYMSTLEERLQSRFNAGLCYDIQLPNLETRVAILKRKMEMGHIEMDDESVFFIANLREANVRELEGYMNRVLSYSSLMGEPVTLKLCEQALHDIMPRDVAREINFETITDAVSMYYGIRIDDLLSKKRSANIAFARMVAMYLCRTYTDRSLKDIGIYYGGRDHATVMHGCRTITEQIQTDASTRAAVEDILQMIRHPSRA